MNMERIGLEGTLIGLGILFAVVIFMGFVFWFISFYEENIAAPDDEDVKRQEIADKLGVRRGKVYGIAVYRLHAQLFPGQEGTPEAFIQAGQAAPQPSQVKSTQTLDDLIARAAQ
jgi:hypothetical protein